MTPPASPRDELRAGHELLARLRELDLAHAAEQRRPEFKRNLPFEGMGAVSTWILRLPKQVALFDRWSTLVELLGNLTKSEAGDATGPCCSSRFVRLKPARTFPPGVSVDDRLLQENSRGSRQVVYEPESRLHHLYGGIR